MARTSLGLWKFRTICKEDKNLENYKSWKGHKGAVRVTHNYQKEDTFYSYEYEARVDCCLYGEVKDRLPAWSDAPTDSNMPIELFAKEKVTAAKP